MNPMLAATWNPKASMLFPKLASPKLDGIRCIIVDGQALTRSLKPIPNEHVREYLSKSKLSGLDGELIVGNPTAKDVWNVTSSAIMTKSGKPDFRFHVFDDRTKPNDPFVKRLASVRTRLKTMPHLTALLLVDHTNVFNEPELLKMEQELLSEGYEGVMLRAPDGIYKDGRSTEREELLLKLKRFTDGEAEIVGFQEFMHNRNPAKRNALGGLERSGHKEGRERGGKLGALVVKDLKSKVVFDIGTGFTDVVRQQLWSKRNHIKGKVVKYKFQPVGVKDKPRFPVYLGFRDAMDM